MVAAVVLQILIGILMVALTVALLVALLIWSPPNELHVKFLCVSPKSLPREQVVSLNTFGQIKVWWVKRERLSAQVCSSVFQFGSVWLGSSVLRFLSSSMFFSCYLQSISAVRGPRRCPLRALSPSLPSLSAVSKERRFVMRIAHTNT